MSRFPLEFESFVLCCCAVLFVACFDSGSNAEADNFDAAVVCPETGTNAYGMANRGTFTDERDGEVYQYTTIGDQVWMAENVRFFFDSYIRPIDSTKIHFERVVCNCLFAEDSCAELGYAYSLNAATEFVCPNGWRLPFKADFDTLIASMGGKELAGPRLRSTSGWRGLNRGENLNGTDDCGFDVRETSPFQSELWFKKEKIDVFTYSSVRISSEEKPYLYFVNFESYSAFLRCIKD